MSNRGHNENAVRLSALVGDAQIALDRVARGEADAIEGWLAYGAALNEGRSLFPSDEQFGQWVAEVVSDNLSVTPNDHERAAAMWAAANSDQFAEARAAGKARTVRGIHAKWKEIEAEREAAAKAEADAIARKTAAEQARQEAEQKAAEEAAAKEAVQAAATPEQREQAEAKVVEATKAKEEAEQKSQAAEAPAAEPDPQAEARKGLSGLTREGLEDEIVGLRAENAELREKLAMVQVERDRFKTANKDLSSSDHGATISRIQKQLQAAKYARDEAMSATKREEYKRKKAEKELARIMGQEIAL